MNLLSFKSGYFEVICHPDKIDCFVKGSESTSGVTINGNFYKIAKEEELEKLIDEYEMAMDRLEKL